MCIIMKSLFTGLLGGFVYTCIFYFITYIYIFILPTPGDGFLATLLSLAILGTLFEFLVAGIATGISGMVALLVIDFISPDNRTSVVICGIVVIIMAIIGFFMLFSLNLTLWHSIIFSGFMLLSGAKLILKA